jgi:hypothetical protein
MTTLKLAPLPDTTPVKLTIELPAKLHQDLIDYAALLSAAGGRSAEPRDLIAPMLAQFMATDRGFRKARGGQISRKAATSPTSGPDQESP